MPHQGRIQKQAPEEDKKVRPEEQFVPEQQSFGMPNSVMMSGMMTPPAGMPNSVMREMDPEDRGVLFGSRGFDPTVGAHELSHTVRRESVPSPVTQSVSSNTIQRIPPDGDEEAAEPEDYEGLSLEEQLDLTLHRAASIKDCFERSEHMVHWRVNQLNAEAEGESDSDVKDEIGAFAGRLDNAISTLGRIIKDLTEAQGQLASGGADRGSIRRLVLNAAKSQREYAALYLKFARFDYEPNMAADLHEIKDMMGDFTEVEDDLSDKNDPDFGFEKVGTPGDYDETPGEAYAVTPGEYDGEPAAAAAAAASPAAAPQQPAKMRKRDRFKAFFGFGKKKDEEKK